MVAPLKIAAISVQTNKRGKALFGWSILTFERAVNLDTPLKFVAAPSEKIARG
jgi:hypothetical protein